VEFDAGWFCYQLHPDAGVALDYDGAVAWRYNSRAARRLAWERWALDVLGDRVEWAQDVEEGSWWVQIDGHGHVVEMRDDGFGLYSWGPVIVCADPVEALARLAFLTGAVLGPEATQ